MGVKGLSYFICKRLPNGTFPINIKEEIRKHFTKSTTSPIIVVDMKCLVYPFLRLDSGGVICGGRFNYIASRMDRFFADLKALGAQLEFFSDGAVRNATTDQWCKKKDEYYRRMAILFDAVDCDEDLSSIQCLESLPFHYVRTMKTIAMKHGNFHWAVARECDQQMAAFANQSDAIAIMTDDTDLMIYEGDWRYWCVTDLNIVNLTLIEYDRVRLVRHLRLSPQQMPLLATLVGNDVVNPMEMKRFHQTLGRMEFIILNVATFIRNQGRRSVDQIFNAALEIYSNNFTVEVLKRCFKKSYESYQTIYEPFNTDSVNDPIESLLLSRHNPLIYQLWHSQNIDCCPGVIDLRQVQLGKEVAKLRVSLILRMGGIILYHRRTPPKTECNIMVKLDEQVPHAVHPRPVIFPTRLEPPTLESLLCNDPVICDELQDMKWKTLQWIVSENLESVETIPEPLQTTVVTLYYLVENNILELFEADLLLQVAYDVTMDKYDPEEVQYPRKLASRPFRVAFVFPMIYGLITSAFNLVGLPGSHYENPPFDGALFHCRYDEWKTRSLDERAVNDDIKEMRIYASIKMGENINT